ncbi:MAG: SUMF1/EgtB/PvdO family nonheme iron enzyme [Flavobacteriales bacterium]|nr:SUMF1/EgtB/PvdO family nonheme iron enzyme [Flavobacteriales bacterium]
MKKIGYLLFGLMITYPVLWAQSQKVQKLKKPADYWAEIPMGSFKNPDKSEVSLQSFWIRKTETSNRDYLEFIAWLNQHNQSERAKKLLPDTTVWRNPLAYNEPYVTYYLRHPAYAEYPVVGVSREMALAYCDWLTDRMNENLHILFPKWKNKKVTVRLPSEVEWMYAASGGVSLATYPWGGPYLRNSKGYYLCNFKRGGEECITYNASTGKSEILQNCLGGDYMGVAGALNEGASITAPVKAYWPHGFGLFNMAGNVSEMVSDSPDAKGGSWRVCGADVSIFAKDPFSGQDVPRADRGFRVAMTVSDK